jgi:predicted metal-dependent HD superfamily phosphohydrolase
MSMAGAPVLPDIGLPNEVLASLRERYAEPGRAYHDWSHIAAMLDCAAALRPPGPAEPSGPAEPEAFHLAILFHDAVYEPRARDNERRSAALLREMLGGTRPAATLDRAARLILATEGHVLPEVAPGPEGEALRADAALFLDLDLAILASPPAEFDRYDAAIRREYAHVPEADYRRGRRAVLEGFLRRDRLFFTPLLGAGAEERARANLRRAIDALEQGEPG